MEHLLIQGGEQFLPFARSRIRALKALGLPYAVQSFEVDGISIKVRIEPGHEYIRLEGGVLLHLLMERFSSSVETIVIDQWSSVRTTIETYVSNVYKLPPANLRAGQVPSRSYSGSSQTTQVRSRGSIDGSHGIYDNMVGTFSTLDTRGSLTTVRVRDRIYCGASRRLSAVQWTVNTMEAMDYQSLVHKNYSHTYSSPINSGEYISGGPFFSDDGTPVFSTEVLPAGPTSFWKVGESGVEPDPLGVPELSGDGQGMLPQRSDPYTVREAGHRRQGRNFIVFHDEVYDRSMYPFLHPKIAISGGAPLTESMYVIPSSSGGNVFEIYNYPARELDGSLTPPYPPPGLSPLYTLDLSGVLDVVPTTDWGITYNAFGHSFYATTADGGINLSFVVDDRTLFK